MHNLWQGYSAYDIVVTNADIIRLREEALYLKNSMILEYIQKRIIHESMEIFPKVRNSDDLIFPQAQIYVATHLLPKFVEELSQKPSPTVRPKYQPKGLVKKRSDETV